jgi:hypothetical protein
VRVIHHQLRRELKVWQYDSIISHQLISYTPPLTGESNPFSAEKRTGDVPVLHHNQPSAQLIHSAPSHVKVIHHQLRRKQELWQYYSIISQQLSLYTPPPLTGESPPPSAEKKT